MEGETEHLIRLLRTELTAVHQQFFHMLALRQWKNEDLLGRITAVDTEDFKNAMQIIDLLVSRELPVALDSHRIFPGSDIESILRAELCMEEYFADVLQATEVIDSAAQDRVDRASAPRRAYREWLTEQLGPYGPGQTATASESPLAAFLAHLIALIEQPMLHAFVLWQQGNRTAADNAWRLSGAAMLYGTSLVRRGVLINAIPTPATIPSVRMAANLSEAFETDILLVRRCAELGRHAAEAEENNATQRLCNRIVDDCNLIAAMDKDDEFPAAFGRSPVFESFAETRERHLN